MSRRMDVSIASFAVATMFGGYHLVWLLLVATGVAQPIADFLSAVHFVKPIRTVEPFDFGLALMLLVLTVLEGAVAGAAFAVLWNRLHRPRRRPRS
jgi:hypothetical protein